MEMLLLLSSVVNCTHCYIKKHVNLVRILAKNPLLPKIYPKNVSKVNAHLLNSRAIAFPVTGLNSV